ncbi:MAG: primosomal protein N' [Pseudarcicella sp.]|nr:primosomal protein N' [Pseudarcicella sp.]
MDNFVGTDINNELSEEVTMFASVILPVPIPKLFTYRIPRSMSDTIKCGARVVVSFGKSKILTAVVVEIHNLAPKEYQAKYILELLDDVPLVGLGQIKLFEWIADYYMCSIGEVLNVALPSGLKLSSESKVQINPFFENIENLNDDELLIINELKESDSLSYNDLEKKVTLKNIFHLLKNLAKKQAIILFEEIKEKYTPKLVKKVRLKKAYENEANLKELINFLEKSPKQLDVLLQYLRNVPVLRNSELNNKGIEKGILTKSGISESSLNTLLKNNIFEVFEIIVSRFEAVDVSQNAEEINLSLEQQKAFEEILNEFQDKNIVLFHGITGSGKTEIYIKLIQQVLDGGSQVLYLLPEIALTTQIVIRLQKVFGSKLGIYHSKFSDNERVEVWRGIIEGKYQLIIGVRSAVFLPFDNLGLIIVDEEHEPSYKQYDPAPRYHARDVALVIGKSQSAKVLLGSATPSIDSYFHAMEERYGFVQLKKRYGDGKLPFIELINIKEAKKNKTIKGDFSNRLLFEVKENLDNKLQTIFFQNRRGYSPYVQCEDCDTIPSCVNCDVSLTFHAKENELKCHYCGYRESKSKLCNACGSIKVSTKGFGTQKIEEELAEIFPSAKIARMDLDTTRSKSAFQSLISEVEAGEIDMLVGTQMISKGLDFERVSLVCIFDADRMIHYPDYRAHERAFQLLTQVAGRAGRRKNQGNVLIQTNNPEDEIFDLIIRNDYETFYEKEIIERESFQFPPFVRIIKITIKHFEQKDSLKAAEMLAMLLSERLGKERILGPSKPAVNRIRNLFLHELTIKLEKSLHLKAVKGFILEQIQDLIVSKKAKGVSFSIDVDAI